jgi:hypothetical protein
MKTVWDYVFAFNNINSGLEKLFSDFNGIREFSKRTGAIDTALLAQFERKNKAVLLSGMADAELIDMIDKLSYSLIKE